MNDLLPCPECNRREGVMMNYRADVPEPDKPHHAKGYVDVYCMTCRATWTMYMHGTKLTPVEFAHGVRLI